MIQELPVTDEAGGVTDLLAGTVNTYTGFDERESAAESVAGSVSEIPVVVAREDASSDVGQASEVSPLRFHLPLSHPGADHTFALDWLLQLSRRSSISCLDSVASAVVPSARSYAHGADEPAVLPLAPNQSFAEVQAGADGGSVAQEERPQSLVEADSVRSFSTSGSSHSSAPSEEPTVFGAEVVSVLDISDEAHAGSLQAAETSSLHIIEGTSASGSPRSSIFASPRPMDEGSFDSLLQRLAFENQLLDESVASSVRRVLQMEIPLQEGSCLTETEIRDLPKVRFTGIDQKEQQQCAICLEAFQDGEILTALRCEHFFHVACVAHWMKRATQCPLCRTPCTE